MCTKSGKIICATFSAKTLDKMLAVCYNGISGAGIRQRAAKKSIGKNAQKKWEVFTSHYAPLIASIALVAN